MTTYSDCEQRKLDEQSGRELDQRASRSEMTFIVENADTGTEVARYKWIRDVMDHLDRFPNDRLRSERA